MGKQLAPTERFTSRVAQYSQYRPGYPRALLDSLVDNYDLTPSKIVADIGSGTGLLTKLLLDNGNQVYGVEPNAAMRNAAERLLAGYSRFLSIEGSAEHTTLPASSVDLVTAGQAFHWFDPKAARLEFARILHPCGMVALIWNSRPPATSAFLTEYEELTRRFTNDSVRIDHHTTEESGINPFFSPSSFERASFANFQDLDFEGLLGRLTSSSYIIAAHHPAYSRMVAELRDIFDRHARHGVVRMDYRTNLYIGRLS